MPITCANHLRETNLTTTMRNCRRDGVPIPTSVIDELAATLHLDTGAQTGPEWSVHHDLSLRRLRSRRNSLAAFG